MIEFEKDNEILEVENATDCIDLQEKQKVKEKVDKKNKNKKPLKQTKECDVLTYIEGQHFIIISFDGYGIRIDGVDNKPNDKVIVEYSGEFGTPGFSVELKK